jgi:hypothetical protein
MNRRLWADREDLDSTSADVVAAIEGSRHVIERFGNWPSFADFEIASLQFDRGNHLAIIETGAWGERIAPTLTAVLRRFDIRYASGDADRKPTLIAIRFHGAFERLALDGFNYQTPICGLEIVFEFSEGLKKNVFAVDWGGAALPHDASFTCERIEIVAVEALSP